MAKTADDLEAVRTVTTALADFNPDEQERIIRWAREKMRLAPTPQALPNMRDSQPPSPPVPPVLPEPGQPAQPSAAGKDVKSFVDSKNPKNDIQFAATVAYFYRFEAPPEHRRNEIDAALLQDACRLAKRHRFPNALLTLNNSKKQGLLDSGSERGKFTINTVGENLVAMTLPGQSDSAGAGKKPKKPKESARKTGKTKK